MEKMQDAGADCFHIDVMDGTFVPNFGCGVDVIKAVKACSTIPMDIHLMIQNPARHIKLFCDFAPQYVTIHPETDDHATRTLAEIEAMGVLPGIAINPGTSVDSIKELLPLAKMVTVMSVNPGFSGQKFLDFTMDKIKTLASLRDKYGYNLCVDGSIDIEKIKTLHPMGVSNFVMGSGLFNEDYANILQAAHQVVSR